MKNILFATTALVATAGVAAAEVSVSGYAEMGIFGDSGFAPGSSTDAVSQFHTDIDVTFKMSGEADNGLTFGATVDLDESNDSDAFSADTQGGETLFVSYGAATLTMGDTDGAYDKALDDALLGDSINDAQEGFLASLADSDSFDGLNGNSGLDGYYDGQIARVDYTFSGFTVSGSVEVDDEGNDVPVWAIGGNYTFEMSSLTLGVGVGYQTVDVEDLWAMSLDAAFDNGFQAIFNYRSAGGDDIVDLDSYGLSLGYNYSGFDLAFNYGYVEAASDATLASYGASVGYDLGGGLAVLAGYGMTVVEDADGDTYAYGDTWSLGLAMSF